jgi:tetratricopeptide (TPR) repeat protein
MSRRSNRELPGDTESPAGSGPLAGQGSNPFGPEVQRHNRWLSLAVCLLLALAVWTVFGQTIHYEFINFDDDSSIYENPIVTQGLNLHGIVQLFTHVDVVAKEWHPLTATSRMLDWQLYGPNAGGHHLTNVLLQAATAILLFLVLRKMTGAMGRSAFVAAVFAVHPLRVESVAWVTERKDVLSGLFFMLTLWAYARHVEHITSARWQRTGTETATSTTDGSRVTCHLSPAYWLALLFFTLGLLSKSMLVTLPFVLLLLDYWPLQRVSGFGFQARQPGYAKLETRNFRQLLIEKIPFLLLAAADCVPTMVSQKHAIVAVRDLTYTWRVGNALEAYVSYLGRMVCPVGLALGYPRPAIHLSVWMVGWSLLVLFFISAGVMAGRRKHPYLLVGWLWYLGMLIPVIDNMQAGINTRADRYTYLPQIGLYILVAWGAVELCGAWRHRRAVLGSAAGVILAGLLAGAYVQTTYWKNNVTLWTHSLACTSEHSVAHNNLGVALAAQGKWAEAIQHYEQALQLEPEDPKALNNSGVALAAQGKWAEAIQHYEQALQLKPDFAEAFNNSGDALAAQGKWAEAIQHYERALQLNPEDPKAYYNLGVALAKKGKLAEAIQHFERALQLKPADPEAHYYSGVALATQGKLDQAIRHYEQALQLKPDYPEAHCNLGVALATQGKWAQAIQHYEQALQLKPDYSEAYYYSGVALAAQGKWAEAIRHYEQALQLKPDYPDAHYNLGGALAAQGKLAEAIQHYERALQLKPDYPDAHYYSGVTLAAQGKLAEAIQHYGRALQLKPEDPKAHYYLGVALAAQGKLAEAVPQFQQALTLATAQGNTALAESIRTRLKSYQPALLQPQTP